MRGEREKGEGKEMRWGGLEECRTWPSGPPHRAGVQPGGGGGRALALAFRQQSLVPLWAPEPSV